MKLASRTCQLWGYWFCSGLGLMSMALFIHPMRPDDFLGLIGSDPLQTLKDPYGIQAAIMFWVSVVLGGIGVAGGMSCLLTGLRRTTFCVARNRRIKTDPYSVGCPQENIAEYWSYF